MSRFDEVLKQINELMKVLEEVVGKLATGDLYYYSLVYKSVYNRKGTEYRYLYLNKYDYDGVKSRYIGKVEDPELASRLQDLRFRSVVKKLQNLYGSLALLQRSIESVRKDVETLARLYDYLESAVRVGRIDGSREQVRIALEMLKLFKELVS